LSREKERRGEDCKGEALQEKKQGAPSNISLFNLKTKVEYRNANGGKRRKKKGGEKELEETLAGEETLKPRIPLMRGQDTERPFGRKGFG